MKVILLTCLICLLSAFASAADIPITGTAKYGYAEFDGDFTIQNDPQRGTIESLYLYQGTPDGPNSVAYCPGVLVCHFSFKIGSATGCMYCEGLSGGNLGNEDAQFVNPELTFYVSAVVNPNLQTATGTATVSGPVVGYELINCKSGGIDCQLGPEVFSVVIAGTGQANLEMEENGSVYGVTVSFSGTAVVANLTAN